ncbi:MAG TPA: glucose-6-phosphate isomerase [Armatimonadota bacterium]|nr:glucose-6-phosphate isomerase [Armatimonadota bacterium]
MQFDLGQYTERVQRTLQILDKQDFSRRLWEKDASLWRQDEAGANLIRDRLGWLSIVADMSDQADAIMEFAEEVKGFKHAVLMGMGGSSLCPEVSRLTFGVKSGYPDLMVLDSTVPETILNLEKKIDVSKTLFIVSGKSGATVETTSVYRYFREKATGKQFVAITDPGTPLEEEVHKVGFRGVFLNPSDIGGRYSALSYFGLVPAAIIGIDIRLLLNRASAMMEECSRKVKPSQNPGVILGTIMAELAMMGRDKLSLVLSPEFRSFGAWIEQLVAESTGKHGTGILPIDGDYSGDDSFTVYVNEQGDSRPSVQINLNDAYDLGGEYFRWEFATAVASALLGVNAFDQPNVQEAKDRTNDILKGSITDCGLRITDWEDIPIFLSQYQTGNYFALMAFLDRSDEADGLLKQIQAAIQKKCHAPVTLGYGPRFLHSTGQFHKGGPNNGLFIQFTADDPVDVPIPGQPYTFSTLKHAQAAGDAIALLSKGRPFVRLHLGSYPVGGLKRILDLIEETN